jgi:hypothetical protein
MSREDFDEAPAPTRMRELTLNKETLQSLERQDFAAYKPGPPELPQATCGLTSGLPHTCCTPLCPQ